MAVFKCKMCGGELNVIDGSGVAECDYCGTMQTVPTAVDDTVRSLFNRANTLRIKSEFDKAERLYEKILQVKADEAEAYWGLILCKYGIEYVEDPTTFKRIPTCHRASFDSILADEDYKSALQYADAVQRDVYEAQAKEIDRIQKEILELSRKEEPYDVFICYKETDDSGKRTQDSVIANDIYYELTNEGFKVFYAAISLEDKLGSAYEPCIFAALTSSKVMLAIGTKPEYFNAVWVKNEWSRFLKMMRADRSKMLIPCYKDMDAYELPEEFAHLQAQDMGKIGFINDIARGIKKVLAADDDSDSDGSENHVDSESSAIAPLLERVELFLEDSDWDSAAEYCERVLDQAPKNPTAYLYKLLADLHLHHKDELAGVKESFEENDNYKKALRFAEEDLKEFLTTSLNSALYLSAGEIIEKAKTEYENLKKVNYSNFTPAWLTQNLQRIGEMYREAEEIYRRLSPMKDSDAMIQFCEERCNDMNYEKVCYEKKYAFTERNLRLVAEEFEKLGDWKDSKAQAQDCLKLADEMHNEETYRKAASMCHAQSVGAVMKAKELFESIHSWKDSEQQALQCEKRIEQLKKDNIYMQAISLSRTGNFSAALTKMKMVEGWKDSAEKIKEFEAKLGIQSKEEAKESKGGFFSRFRKK